MGGYPQVVRSIRMLVEVFYILLLRIPSLSDAADVEGCVRRLAIGFPRLLAAGLFLLTPKTVFYSFRRSTQHIITAVVRVLL